MNRTFFSFGSAFALMAVAAGAFGAHLLANQLSSTSLEIFQTAARYQMYHALVLLGVAWLCGQRMGRWIDAAGWCFVAGTILFSGSLYALSLGGVKVLGVITPLGGVGFMAGWALLLWFGLTVKK
ncbi:DUF423 domain-containing protein [Anthocerotibacter panamensis]|uniref:DUF423 domain-containing protein n=1 Tax=Anthocerotibacter panamensis TaxID=2857077 RepID=UPI001C403D2D|nr:DUF423 domain-containing protein [Anthocerotibacter panamensis]